MRINKYLRDAGLESRRKCEELVEGGKVSINGKVVRNLAFDVKDEDIVEVDGKILTGEKNLKYLIMNKPKGYITTKKDELGRKTVMELLGPKYADVFPVGRLDYNTEGLLILTNDGDLSYKLTHPKNQIKKVYIATIKGDISNTELDILRGGFLYKGVRYGKCEAKILDKHNGICKVQIIVTEGKNHEIRNMFEYLHKDLHLLKRVSLEGLTLRGLNRGESRLLSRKEVEYLKSL